MSSIIEAKEVSKVYQMGSTTVAALDRVSLAVNEREYVAIQGTSGSGKSTLLNVIGGLDHPTSGEVLFESKSPAPIGRGSCWPTSRPAIWILRAPTSCWPCCVKWWTAIR